VIAGQGHRWPLKSCGRPRLPLTPIYVLSGGGGLIAGIGRPMSRASAQGGDHGVERGGMPTPMTRSLAAGKRVCLERSALFADGVGGARKWAFTL